MFVYLYTKILEISSLLENLICLNIKDETVMLNCLHALRL